MERNCKIIKITNHNMQNHIKIKMIFIKIKIVMNKKRTKMELKSNK